MAVIFPLIFLLAVSGFSFSIEKSIRENWSKLSYPHKVLQLYRLLGFKCLWYCNGTPTPELDTFERLLEEARYHGLNPEDYTISSRLDPELAVSDSLIKLSYHLYYGRVKPSELYGSWNFPQKQDRVIETLASLIREGRLSELFAELAPKRQEYWFLVEQARLLEEASLFEWKPLKLQKTLQAGDKNPVLEEVRFRLFLLGDLENYQTSKDFDQNLLSALKSFQERHGLAPTGKLDKKTLQHLNMSPEERLWQIYLNLEKHRWLPEEIRRAVVVNIPSFELFLIEDSTVRLHSRVIVGRNYKNDFRPTPMLYSRIQSITVNPRWYVPVSISVKDILPKVKKNPSYLTRKGFRVFLGEQEVDPLQIDWSIYSEKNFPFRLVQEPGARNALGRIKFNFPNPFAVYLHDTPDRHLFKHTHRAFSSGCIRVEKAKDLALALLGEDWSARRLDELIRSGQTYTLTLKNPVPIYILYFTAFEREGKLHFREDIYGYDTILSRALQKSGGKR